MVHKPLVAIALAAAQISLASATACGWPGETCCDLDPHNPNIGTCSDDRNVCWEGVCMDCGLNGKIKCNTHPPCEDDLLLNSDGWCHTDPHAPVVHTCNEPCGHGNVCYFGNCVPCGNNGQPKCDEGRECGDGLVVNHDGFCTVDVTCGWDHTICCANDFCHGENTCVNGKCMVSPASCENCGHGEVCFFGQCRECGNNGQPKCNEGAECTIGLVVNDDGFCTQGAHCGWIHEDCCPGHICYDGTVCSNGKCATPPPPPPPAACGWQGEVCCENNMCLARNTSCRRGMCRRNRW